MNEARYHHSSCFFCETKYFVFGGFKSSGTFLDSIDFMDIASRRPWLLLRLDEFGERTFPADIALNEN